MKLVTIVGAGALGSHAALYLRNEAELKLIDYDRVDERNVETQFHGRPSLGRNKAEALKQTLQFLFGVKVVAVPHRLTEQNVERLLEGAHLVLDCVDDGVTRRTIQQAVRAAGTPCVHGALAAADERLGRVVWDEAFVPDDGAPDARTCDDASALPFVAGVAAHLAHAAQVFLREGRRLGYHVHGRGSFAL